MPWLTEEAVVRAVRSVDATRFAAFCDAVLRVEGARPGIPVSHLDPNLNITEPDGGLDASCKGAPRHGGILIPAADVGYQLRGGVTARSANKVSTEDILNERKPRPREYLSAGRPFVFMTAADRGNYYEQEIRAAVRERVGGEFTFRDEQIVVFTAGRLANQVLAAPALARLLGFGQELPIIPRAG